MTLLRISALTIAACVSLAHSLGAQAIVEEPQKVSTCELLNHRDKWNRKLVQVSGFASHGFEDSNFSDPTCDSRYGGLWMEYGGKLRTGTMSTASNWDRTATKPLTVAGIEVSLIDDSMFRRFDDFLHLHSPSMTVHATVIARFFAGSLEKYPNGERYWGGYGHLGCCSLFVIQQVLEVDDHVSPGLDYSETPEQPDTYPFRGLALSSTRAANLRDQRAAEEGVRAFAFSDSERVAREAILENTPAPKVASQSLILTKASGNAFHRVYKATVRSSDRQYMVVLSRPYWLSYSAKDPNHVPWVVLAAYEIEAKDGDQ